MKKVQIFLFFILIAIFYAIGTYYGRIYFPENFRPTEVDFIENFIVLYLVVFIACILLVTVLNELFDLGIE